MIDALSLTITLGCLLGSGAVLTSGAIRRYRWQTVVPMLLMLECALLVQGILDATGILRGHRPGELATHLAYLVTSLAVLPVAAVQGGGEDGRWPAVLIAVALLVCAVIVIRLQTTWRISGA